MKLFWTFVLVLATLVAVSTAGAAPHPQIKLNHPARAGEPVRLTGSGCGDGPCRYTWRINGHIRSHSKAPRVTFRTKGWKTLRLGIRDDSGALRHVSKRVYVRPPSKEPPTPTDEPLASCDASQGSSESIAAFVSRVAAGTSTDRTVLCLRAGTQNIGDNFHPKTWTTLQGAPGATTKLIGEVRLTVPGIKLVNFEVEKENPHGSHALVAIDGGGSNSVVHRLELDGLDAVNGTEQVGSGYFQGIIISGNPSNVTITENIFHDIGDSARGAHDHAIYCSGGTGGLIEGNWFYSNDDGYSFHFYGPGCDNYVVQYNITDGSAHGTVLDQDPDNNVFTNNIFTNMHPTHQSGEALRCYAPGFSGTGNVFKDFVNPAVGTGCGGSSGVVVSGERTNPPTYVNAAAHDYRLTPDSAHRDLMGPYSDAVPGPQ